MEQPRPLRRRRRSSRRGAGPPTGPGAGTAAGTPTTADPPSAASNDVATDIATDVATDIAASTGAPSGDRVTGGIGPAEPYPDDATVDGTSFPATPSELTNPQVQPVAATVVANAGFAASTELNDPRAGSAAPGVPHAFAGSPGAVAATGPGHPAEHGRPSGDGPRRNYRTPREDQSERSLRALVTTRSTQVSPTAAMRAREVAMPTASDLLAAEADLVVVRRHYVPPTALAAGRRRDRSDRRPSAASQNGNTESTGGNPPAGQQ